MVAAVAVTALAVTVAACSGSKPEADKCQSVSAPLTDIPTRTDQEPKMRIPVPPGWERSTKMDSEQIRFSIRNQGLTADGFTPNAVVTLQKVAGDLGKPEQILEAQQDQLNKKLKLEDVDEHVDEGVWRAGVVIHVHHPRAETAPNEGVPEAPHDSATQGHLAGHRLSAG